MCARACVSCVLFEHFKSHAWQNRQRKNEKDEKRVEKEKKINKKTPHLLILKRAMSLSSVCMHREIMRENRQEREGGHGEQK